MRSLEVYKSLLDKFQILADSKCCKNVTFKLGSKGRKVIKFLSSDLEGVNNIPTKFHKFLMCSACINNFYENSVHSSHLKIHVCSVWFIKSLLQLQILNFKRGFQANMHIHLIKQNSHQLDDFWVSYDLLNPCVWICHFWTACTTKLFSLVACSKIHQIKWFWILWKATSMNLSLESKSVHFEQVFKEICMQQVSITKLT